MKTRIEIYCIFALFILPALVARADNPCITAPTTNSITCQEGTLSSGYIISPTNININIGQAIQQPSVFNLSMTNGSEIYYYSNVCYPDMDGWYTNDINYEFSSLYFTPALPPVFWTSGVFAYTGLVDVAGSLCGPWTTNVGIVTVDVASNNPDVLIDVAFGSSPISTKTGYAAIGNLTSDFWNEYGQTNQPSGSLPNLLTVSGQVSPVGLLVTNLPTWGTNGSPDPMYDNYLSAIFGEVATLSITNLPLGLWNIYLYSDDSSFDLRGYDGYQICYDQPLSGTLWQPGLQYVVFTNVLVTNDQPVTIDIYPGENYSALISGMQIASAWHRASTELTDHVLAYYPFNGNANDVSGNNLNAQVYGATLTTDRFGNANSAYSFDGSDDYMTISDTNSLLNFNVLSNSYTIALWVKLANLNQDQRFLIDRGTLENQAVSYEFSYNSASNTFAVDFWDGQNGSPVPYLQSVTTAVTNVWYHIALVCDAGTPTLYVNGQPELGPQLTPGSPNYIPSGFTSTLNTEKVRTIGRYAGINYSDYTSGALDDIIYYGRALSASEIDNLYEIGPIWPMQDSDYDGVSDLHELADRTDPNNPNSVLPVELGSWSFDNTNTWAGDQGQLPLVASNIVGIVSWETNAVLIDTNKPAVLCYRDVETNGDANINLRCGTVRFWFRPDWSSSNQGGSGPGTPGRLIEMGNYNLAFTNGWWALYLSADGTQLSFGCSTNGAGMTNLTASVSWVSNVWGQITLTYSATNSLLYFNGQLLTNSPGAIYYPNVGERATGFRIGSDENGTNQARGAFDDLETFNYPLNASDISNNYEAKIEQDSDGDGLPDVWEMDYYGHLGVDPNAYPDTNDLDNAQLAVLGLNPQVFEDILLGYWRFNNAPTWQDEQGLAPSVTQDLFPVPDWSGDAVEINSQMGSVLTYPGVRSNGVPVLTFPTGSISFWFKPDWSSANPTNWYGGPGATVNLFEIGSGTSSNTVCGWFGLTIDSLGTELSVTTVTNGVQNSVLQASQQEFNSHTWYQFVLTYSTQQTALYINNQLTATGAGLSSYPNSALVQQGFHFGCNWDGTGQAGGRFDELRTFSYALSSANVTSNYDAAMSILAVDGLSAIIKDGWGLRIDAFDSLCDGVPDAWKIENGYNPKVPFTTEQLAEYEGSGLQDSMVNIGSVQYGPTTNSFGSFPPGNYTVTYVTGAWLQGDPLDGQNDLGWCVAPMVPNPGIFDEFEYPCQAMNPNDYYNPLLEKPCITVRYQSGNLETNGYAWFNSLTEYFDTQQEAENASSNSSTSFTHYGGDISLIFYDGYNFEYIINSTNIDSDLSPYSESAAGDPPPTYLLSPVLPPFQARGGQDAVYLIWPSIGTNADYNLYRSVGSTNSWALLETTTYRLSYQDNGLTPGTTYYYQLQWTNEAGVATNSPVVSAVPFECSQPLAPIIDYVQTLGLQANNNTYKVPFGAMMTNSDAYDPQGLPMVFKVVSIVNGSLMISNAPFGVNNCTIDTNTAVLWTPPPGLSATNTVAFRVYVFDGINRSTNTVNVFIKTGLPASSLFAWGYNVAGQVGNGTMYIDNNMDGGGFSNILVIQQDLDIYPADPRWQCFFNGDGGLWQTNPEPVLDLSNVAGVFPSDAGSGFTTAVTPDGNLWNWGSADSVMFGKPLVKSPSLQEIWQWGDEPAGVDDLIGVGMYIPSPIPSQTTIGNISSVCGEMSSYRIILKNDGTLWSVGSFIEDGSMGRDPSQDPSVLSLGNEGSLSLVSPELGQINVPGKVVEVCAGANTCMARCADGSVWSWGTIIDEWGGQDMRLGGSLGDGYPLWQPERVTTLDISNAAPIVQISTCDDHYVILRQDRSVSEMGAVLWLGFDYGEVDTNVPVPVTGLPQNVSQVCAGYSEDGVWAAALTSDGNVWVWGATEDTNTLSPRQVTSLQNIVKIAVGEECVLAVDKYGALWGWGLNYDYFLSTSSTNDFYTQAVRIQGIQNVTDVFCSKYVAYAIGTAASPNLDPLVATPMNQAVQLSWTNYPGASYYIVYRSVNPDVGYTAVGRTPNISFVDQNPPLVNGQTYYYEISAVIAGVETRTSWSVAATPLPPPTPVQNLAASGECVDVMLTWDPPTNSALSNPQEYLIERANTSSGPFQIITYCQGVTNMFEDNTVFSGQTYYYQVIPVNAAGMGSSVTVSGAIDTSSCTMAPLIVSNWLGYQWFTISYPGYPGEATTANLYWTGPPYTNGTSWGSGVQFCVQCHYSYPNGGGTFYQSEIINDSDAENGAQRSVDGGTIACYSTSWQIPPGVQCWSSVSAIVTGQQGASSIEVGPLSSSPPITPWQVTPETIPGYQQVYLDWPDDVSIYNFQINCTALIPSQSHNWASPIFLQSLQNNAPYSLSNWVDWVTLAGNLQNPRYWHTDTTPTNFSPADFKYVGEFISNLTNSVPGTASYAVWTNLSPVLQTNLINFGTNVEDVADPVAVARTNLAAALTQIIQSGQLVYNTNDVGMEDPDLSTETKTLLGDWNSGTIGAVDLATLNRLLLEDAFVRDIARYETPSPAEFVSGDFNGFSEVLDRFYYYYHQHNNYPVASNLWNLMSASATNQIMTNFDAYGSLTSDPTNLLALQRTLAMEFTRIVQTNVMLFTTNQVLQDNGGNAIWDRPWNLINNLSELTNNYPLLNRLLIEDAWGNDSYGGPNNFSIEPLSDLRYYWVTAQLCNSNIVPSYWVGARPNDQASAPPPLDFSAQATASSGLVTVQWNIPGSSTNSQGAGSDWQFFVARNGNDGTPYVPINETGFGTTYLDSGVTNGMPYQYRVTAIDTNYNCYVAVTSSVTPTNSLNLVLLPPQAGNDYVNLTWTPVAATSYVINRATSLNGSYYNVGRVDPADVAQDQQNVFQDVEVQNGITYYYQIEAITPSGFPIYSEIQSATPSGALAPPAPNDFQGQYVPDPNGGPGQFSLSWNPANGAASYQIFLVNQSRYTPLPGYDGIDTSCAYNIPLNTDPNTVFTFALRSIGPEPADVAGGFVETTVTNTPPPSETNPPAAIVLQVGSSVTNCTVFGPTNLALVANVNAPAVSQVDFYADGALIGVVNGSGNTFQMMWYNVPSGTHTMTAVGLASDPISLFGNDDGNSYNSSPVVVTVNVQSLLSPYQSSVTDLQLPAPGLPIAISRSYTSRSTATNGALGIGWSAGWATPCLTLSTNLDQGWVGVVQTAFTGSEYYFGASAGHYITVNLPSGQNVSFAPGLNRIYTGGTFPEGQNESIPISNQPCVMNGGTLTSVNSSLYLQTDSGGIADEWNGVSIQFSAFNPGSWTYIGSDGTQYVFGQEGSANGLTWLLTQETDLSGNSLFYAYDASNNVTCISNSCGRAITFNYVTTGHGTNIEIFDADGRAAATVVYVVSNNQLVAVQQLTGFDTSNNGIYITNSYAYGNNATGDPQDYGRLTQVFDARGIQMAQNVYTNGDGDLLIQISPGETNYYAVDTNTASVTISSATSTATNTTAEVNNSSGMPGSTTLPASGNQASGTLSVSNIYNSNGQLSFQTDANGNSSGYMYDALSRLIGKFDQNGNGTISQLDKFGKPTISTNANGAVTLSEYDSSENPTAVMDPSETLTTYTYSQPTAFVGEQETSESQLAPYVPYTIVTTNVYDTSDPIKGDLLQTAQEWTDGTNVIGNPATTTYTYDANGNKLTQVTSRTVPGGTQFITTSYTYDTQNRVIMTVVSASGGSQTFVPQTNTVTYDELGKQATTTDAAGRTTTNIYDFRGDLIETEYLDGTVSRTVFDGFGHEEYVQDRTVPDGSGNTTAPATYSVYDASGRVIQTGRSDNVELSKVTADEGSDYVGPGGQLKMVVTSAGTVLTTNLTFYDAVGNVQYSVDQRGAVTEIQYDAANRRTNTIVYLTNTFVWNGTNVPTPSGTNQSTSYSYDADGNQLTETDARGNTTTSYYDDSDQLIRVDEPGSQSGTVSQFTYYDGLGRKIESDDELGVATACTYDFRGLLTSVTKGFGTPQSVTTVYQYDEAGNEISQMDAVGRETTFQYDALGRRTGRTLPGGQSEEFAYDADGNQTNHTTFNGTVITSRYDVDNRLTNCSSVNYEATYAYDLLGNRTNMTDTAGTTTYFYNQLNELTNKTVSWNSGPTVSLKYGYDVFGSITNIQSSTVNGVNLAYQYDILGRLTNVLAGSSSIANYAYDVVGNRAAMVYGNGVTNLYQYDAMNRLTNQVCGNANSTLANFAYTLRATGNRVSLLESVNGNGRYYAWNYDPLYRLTSEVIRGATVGNLSYAYDPVGNRTNRTSDITGLANQSPIYNRDDWMTNTDKYDADGNTTNSDSNFYQYDVLDHLTNVNIGQIVMTYDGDGDRMSKKVGSTTTYYLLDDENPSGYSQLLEEWTSTGTPSLSKVYNYGLDLILERQPSVSTNYFIFDGHGSTRALTDTGGTVVNVFAYDAYGNLIASNGAPQTAYMYCGQQWDFDLQLYINRARYLNPNTGRFWTMDSYEGDNEDPLSLHKYLYAEDEPVDSSDPSGNYGEFDISSLAIGGLLATIGPSVTAETGLGEWTAPTVSFKYYVGSVKTAIVPYWGAGRWGQPATLANGRVWTDKKSEMDTSVWVSGQNACNTSLSPGKNGQMYLPNGQTVGGACGSVQATISGQGYQSYQFTLVYTVKLVNRATFTIYGPDPKAPPISPKMPYGSNISVTKFISGRLDANGHATITYIPSIGQRPPRGKSQTSMATGSIRIVNLK